RLGPARRHRRDPPARERARILDHAGQGQSDPMRGADHGGGAGHGQSCHRHHRRRLGPSRAQCVQAGDRRQRAALDSAACRCLRQLRRALRHRHRGRSRPHRRSRRAIADAGDGAQPAYRLRQGGRDRQAGPQGGHEPARGGGRQRLCDGAAVRRLGPPGRDDRAGMSLPDSKQRAVAPATGPGMTALLGMLSAFGPMSVDMYLPSLPSMTQTLGAGPALVQLTLSAFFLGFALGQLVYGPLSDRYGRRRPLLAGLLLYTVASLVCAVTPSVWPLIFGRLLEGLGACAGPVLARAVVRDLYDRDRAARMLSILFLVLSAAPLLAPSIGGQILIWV